MLPWNISHACDVDCVLDYLMNEFEISAFSLESVDLLASGVTGRVTTQTQLA